MTHDELRGYFAQLQAKRDEVLKEADRIEWHVRILRTRATKIDDEINRVLLILNPPKGAMVKYVNKDD